MHGRTRKGKVLLRWLPVALAVAFIVATFAIAPLLLAPPPRTSRPTARPPSPTRAPRGPVPAATPAQPGAGREVAPPR